MGDADHGQEVSQEHKRSPHWPHVRDQFLKTHAKCAACSGTESLEAHHIVPFHVCIDVERGYAELDPRNLVTLCRGPRNCHLLLGHLDDFKSFFLGVRSHLPHWVTLLDQAAIKADHSWQMSHLHRPAEWGYKTTEHEKAAILAYIDHHYPIATEVTA